MTGYQEGKWSMDYAGQNFCWYLATTITPASMTGDQQFNICQFCEFT